jgi:hypothetical protein
VPLHPRTEIRRAVVTRLRNVTNQPLRITDSRVTPHRASQLPLVSVGTTAERVTANDDYDGARILTRELTVEVEIARASNTDDASYEAALAETLESDCRYVELAIAEDETLAGRVRHIILESTAIRFEPIAQTPVGIALLTFTATYEAPAQETVLPEFSLGTVKWDLAPPDGITDAEDTLDVQE